MNQRNNPNQSDRKLLTVSDRDIFVTTQKALLVGIILKNEIRADKEDKQQTELLWDRIEEVIREAASFKDFETKVTLEDWQPGSIIIIVNVIKNIKSLWTKEEVERFVERFTKGIEKLKLESPLKFSSVNIGNFIMCELAISSTCEDMMEMVDGFLDTFEQKLIPFSVNGAPGKLT